MTGWQEVQRGEETDLSEDIKARVKKASPYVHWFASEAGGGAEKGLGDLSERVSFLSVDDILRTAASLKGGGRTEYHSIPPIGRLNDTSMGAVTAGVAGSDILALPKHAERPSELDRPWLPENFAYLATGVQDSGDWEKDRAAMQADLPADTVIIGILDEGIAWGHDRFRLPSEEGSLDTRFLAAWLQGGVYRDDAAGNRAPFGRDLFRTDIRDAMARHGAGPWLDEDMLYQELDPAPEGRVGRSDGARLLRGAVTHGTHVLDLACGGDPFTDDAGELRRRRIIAVNLPSRESIGMAGTFLEFYVINAMRRIEDMANRLYEDIHGEGPGFPVLMNISYGQQSGTKTGSSLIEQQFSEIRKARGDQAPVHLIMPVGNDNLTRSNARWRLRPPAESLSTLSIDWRIPPEDQSSNFVEIWVDLLEGELDAREEAAGGRFPLLVSLEAPGETGAGPRPWIAGKDGHFYTTAEGDARIYASLEEVPDLSPRAARREGNLPVLGTRLRYLVALRPTLDHARPERIAKGGLWRISVAWDDSNTALDGISAPATGARAFFRQENGEDQPRNVYINVQVDQNASPASATNRRSYFDEPSYRSHLPNGRPLDSFAYLESESGLAGRGDDLTPADVFGAVQRKGTQNALANLKSIHAIAGHRESDGRPADFSATYFAEKQIADLAQPSVASGPTASFPVDRGTVALGMRAAAPSSGATAILRGTSFAAPQATRWLANVFLAELAEGKSLDHLRSTSPLKTEAAASDQHARDTGRYSTKPSHLKTGPGRMPPNSGRTYRGP
ncbi:MAG: hypothetical protein AAF683_02825 [Pseudomonadota bacterium]